MYNFFSPDENELRSVIQTTLEKQDEVKSVSTIQTGWTNITMDVQGEKQAYIFRFPRNLFFANMIMKDCLFCNFLRGKVCLPVPQMELVFNQNRPFSVHPKIVGESLSSKMDELTNSDQEKIVDDLSGFLTQLHTLPLSCKPDEVTQTLGEFLDDLAGVHNGDYNFSYHIPLHLMEKDRSNLKLVHGDFHPGNILIHEGRVSGVIDFAFASLSDEHADLGRFVGRSNADLGHALVEAYQRKTNKLCDQKKIDDVVDVFKYVEYKYVQYMQSYHPEITISDFVLDAVASAMQKFETV